MHSLRLCQRQLLLLVEDAQVGEAPDGMPYVRW